jgi:hypothetical protein
MDGNEDDVKQSKPGSERQRWHVFSHMWKIDPKDKHIQKYKCVCIYTYIYIHIYMYIYIKHVYNHGTV